MPIERNSEGTNNPVGRPSRDLVRQLIARKSWIDTLPSLDTVLGTRPTQQIMEPVSREEQLMSGALYSISERLSSPLAEALRR